jgi:molybdate transport system ATP-binding protein
VGIVGREITAEPLRVRVRKTRAEPGGVPFVLDVDLEFPAGINIVFGPSGAGKSTLLDCIAGLLRADAGRVAMGESVLLDVERRTDLAPAKRHLAYVFQNLALFPHLSVERNVAYGISHIPAGERMAGVTAMLQLFRVDKLATRMPNELSGGERQRVALARSLATSPRVLLLDEPLTALDAGLKKSIMDDLRTWNAAHHIPIVYVTHSRDEADALGERMVALEHGKVIGMGTPLEVLDAPRRSALAQASGFENVFDAEVVELRASDGVMRVRLEPSACEIETPLGYATAGDRVRVAIRAGDLLLATDEPHGLSARNILEGKIVSLEQRGTMFVAEVVAGNASPAKFVVHLTPGAKRELQLEVRRQVWLVLKTHSCHLLAA